MDTTKIFLHQIAAPGLPGNITEAEAAAIRADQAAILARPTIEKFTDIPDVAGAPDDGQVWAWDAASSTLVPITPGVPLEMQTAAAETRFGPVRVIDARNGLVVTEAPSFPGIALLEPVWGGNGSANAVARSDHFHGLAGHTEFSIAATGSLSSGTRTLVSSTVSLSSDRGYWLWAILILDIRGEGAGAGRSRPQITIGGTTSTRHTPARTVQGVDREVTTLHRGYFADHVSSVAVSAAVAHVDGDPKYIDAGRLLILAEANR